MIHSSLLTSFLYIQHFKELPVIIQFALYKDAPMNDIVSALSRFSAIPFLPFGNLSLFPINADSNWFLLQNRLGISSELC